MKTIITYGSLKKGKWLHDDWMRGSKFIGECKIEGFIMYSLGQYPAIKPSDERYCIKAEIFEISDKLYEQLKHMEESAGYETTQHTVDGITGTLWVYRGTIEHAKIVQSGDW